MERLWIVSLLSMVIVGLLSHQGAADDAAKPASSMPIPKAPLLGPTPPVRCMKWDYFLHPIKVTASSTPEPGRWIRWSCDGYPTSRAQPLPREHWRTAIPADDKPETLTLDYERPVAVTRFVHYFDHARPVCAWKDVDVQSSSDGESWKTVQSFTNLPSDYPQVLPMDDPALARYYRFVIKSLAEGAAAIASYEIETYYGATVGKVECARAIQSEDCTLKVRVLSPDAAIGGATLKLIAPEGHLKGALETPVPTVVKGASSTAQFRLVPLRNGPVPVMVELHAGGFLIDRRPYTIEVRPKLTFATISPVEAVQAAGKSVTIEGSVSNTGTTSATGAKVTWMGASAALGDLPPGRTAPFKISTTVQPGYAEGVAAATDSGLARTALRQPIICQATDRITAGGSTWTVSGDGVKTSLPQAGSSVKLTGDFRVFASGKQCPLVPVSPERLAARVPGGVFVMKLGKKPDTGDLGAQCSILPDDPNPLTPPWLELELRLAIDNPKVMFRPHIDWYTVEHGPNVPQPSNGHNYATRMVCIETGNGTVSMVPDTDNLIWGFTEKNEMTAAFRIPLGPQDPLGEGFWPPLNQSPMQFSFVLPVRKGDWWDAYRYVVQQLFKFEQPRQWALSVTQMQMHNARYVMNYASWSEKSQTVRSFPGADVFFNFYGTTYTLPSLYSWYLATDNDEAKVKAGKVLDWLLKIQEKEGPAAGAWFSQYYGEGDPATKWVGYDQAGNRWIMPHSTGTAAKTLLWYWEASGKTDQKAFDAARRGCDWLISTQREDGGWPYAFDLEGKPVTELSDAGQIWCTWALWHMHRFSGEEKYKTAALRSAECFKKTFMDVHRYMGYWEDVSGGAGQVTRSWEAYEPAIGALVFTDMGRPDLALECAKDTATWSWTRVTSTRQYETCYGQTTEQSFCGPSQAQSPMVGVGLHQVYATTGDTIWSDFAGAMKAINFCADPDQGYGMTATTGWFDPTTAVAGPPFDNVRPWITHNNRWGDEYGRGVWIEWQTSQFAWLALEWLIREGNIRAPQFVKIDPNTLRGTVLGDSGRIKMVEERCDIQGIDHYDINWIGYANDRQFALLIMNHKEKTEVMVRPHEAHLDVYCRPPRVLIGSGKNYREVNAARRGVQYTLDIPANSNAILVWDRIK